MVNNGAVKLSAVASAIGIFDKAIKKVAVIITVKVAVIKCNPCRLVFKAAERL